MDIQKIYDLEKAKKLLKKHGLMDKKQEEEVDKKLKEEKAK